MTEDERAESVRINVQLKELLVRRLPEPGDYSTAIDGLMLLRREASSHSGRCYEHPLAAFIIQGSKHSFFGAHEYIYAERQCLVRPCQLPPNALSYPFFSIWTHR